MNKIKETLENRGYTFKGWMEAEETDVVKTIGPHGNTVYIALEKPSYKNDKHKYLLNENDTVPVGLVQDTMDLVARLTGAVISCENGTCILHDGGITHYDHNYPMTEKQKGQINTSPIIHYDEVLKQPKEALENIELVAGRLMNDSMGYCINCKEEFNRAFIDLEDAGSELYNRLDYIISDLIASTGELREEIIPLAKEKPNSPEHEELKSKLLRREQILGRLTKYIRGLKDKTKELDAIRNYIKRISDEVQDDYNELGA